MIGAHDACSVDEYQSGRGAGSVAREVVFADGRVATGGRERFNQARIVFRSHLFDVGGFDGGGCVFAVRYVSVMLSGRDQLQAPAMRIQI